ncbi:hypothetical protein BGX38DRAFT_1281763 [Terfezia claveryi]|nr:hypothetical protein BGX38DRAFT_1281763 [Terfezia claveryi]
MRCRFCDFEFQKAGQYGRHLRAQHSESASAAQSHNPVEDQQEQRHPYTNSSVSKTSGSETSVSVRRPAWLKRTRSVSPTSTEVRTIPAKRLRQTGALLSTYLNESLGDLEVRTSSVEVGDVFKESGRSLCSLHNICQQTPFQNAYEYKLARFFHESKTSLTNIDRFFKQNLLPPGLSEDDGVHFHSGYTWRNKMREMIDQPGWQTGTVDFHLQKGSAFYYRDLEDTVRYLLQQRAYGKHLVFAPIHEFDEKEGGSDILCGDGKVRKCIPVLSAWLADHMENVNIHDIKTNRCPVCIVSPRELGILRKKSQPMHNHAAYENLYRAGDLERLDDAGIKPFENALWVQLQVLGIQPPDMVRGDILHNILLGILKHLMGWIEQFLKKHKCLEVFDRIWEQIPPYPGYQPPQKRYRQITMWSVPESHTATIGYMDLYLRKFHDNLPVFTEFRATKKDHENAKEASRELAADQLSAHQAKLDEYFELSATKRTKIATEERQERQQVIQDVLCKADFNFPKLHLLSHYTTQIKDFGLSPTEQILDTITVEHALRMRELNMEEWSQGYRFSRAILDVIQRRRMEDLEETTIRAGKPQGPILRGKQASDGPEGTPMQTLAARLGIGQLPERFFQYLRLNTPEPVNLEGVAHFPMHYYAELSVKVPEFQGEGKQTHNVQWTAQKAFRKQGQPRADWVWVRRKGRSEYSRGDLDGKIVGKLEGLFSVRDNINRVHEVALVSILRVRGSSRPGRDEGMVRMEGREDGKGMNILRITDIEGMAHVIGLKEGNTWLVNNRIDFHTWNELYSE